MAEAPDVFAFRRLPRVPAQLLRLPQSAGPWLLAAHVLLASACEGTSTGNPTDGQPPGKDPFGEEVGSNGGAGGCEPNGSMEIALDAKTALGFAPSDVLSFVEGTREETLTWNPQEGFEYGPESGQHKLTIRIARQGAPRLAHYKRKQGDGRGVEIALPQVNCSDAIEIDVEVKVATDEGALDETFETTIVVRDTKSVTLSLRVKDDQLTGSFAPTKINLPSAKLVQLTIGMNITPHVTLGSFQGILEQRLGGAVSAGTSRQPIASWGPQSCRNYRGTPVPRGTKLDGVSGEDVLALLNRAASGSANYSNGTSSPASLAFAISGEHVCVAGDDDFATIGGPGTIYVPAILQLKTADGRVDAHWPVAISGKKKDDALESVEVTLEDERLTDNTDFATKYGIKGVDVAGYDHSSLRVTLSATPTAPTQGEVEAIGYKLPNCPTGVMTFPDGTMGTAGCPGATPTTLERIRISTTNGP